MSTLITASTQPTSSAARKQAAATPFESGQRRAAVYKRDDALRHLEAIADSPDAIFSFRVIPEHPHLVARRSRLSLRYNYRGTFEELEQTLMRRNLEGCAIFFTPNKTDGRGVKKINVTQVRAIVLDLDGSPLPKSWRVEPHIIVETSAGRYQVTWCIKPTSDIEAAEDVAKRLAAQYHGDPNVFDASHVFRLAGFAHQKRGLYRSRLIAIREFDRRISLAELDASLPRTETPPKRNASSNADVGVLDARAARLLFEHLSVDMVDDNAKWTAFAMALNSACNADDEVAELFFEFCAQDPRYANNADDTQNRIRWASFDAKKPGGVTIRSLEKICRENCVPEDVLLSVFNSALAIGADEFDSAEADASLADYPEADFDFDCSDDEFNFDTPAKPKAFHYDMNKLSAMLAFAERAMLDGGVPLYQTGERLVLPVRTDADTDEEAIRRKAGSLTIRDMSALRLQNFMIQHAQFYKLKQSQKDDAPKRVQYPATLQLAQHYIAAADTWRLPVLNGIVETPTLRADGTLIQDEGFDEASRLLLDFGGVDFGHIKDDPTRADALKALKALREPFKGFPFVVDADGKSASRAVMLSAVLTGLVRRSLTSAPMHAVSAPTAGTGKSLAIDVVSMIVAGRPAAAMSQGASEEEDEKRLLASLMRGDQILMLDNVRRAIQGDALCSILTQASYKGRVLGESRTVEVKTNVLLMASGNGLQFAGDMGRRALLCLLDAGVERPEERRFDVDLKTEVPKRRVELVVAGLTILRAFAVAGRPGLDKLKPFGSFESWSNLVRGALVWLGESDPCVTTDWIREDDPIKESLEQLLLSIYAVNGKRWFGAGELLDEAERAVDDEHDRRLDSINSALNGAKISRQALAAYLKVNTGRIVTRMRIERARDKVTKSWRYRVAKLE